MFGSPLLLDATDSYEKLRLSVVSLHTLGRAGTYHIQRILTNVEQAKRQGTIIDKSRVVELASLISGNLKMVPKFCAHLGIQAGHVIEDIFAMVWGVKRIPLELTAALDLHFTKGVLLWHFIELNVMGELIKRFIFK